MPVSILRRPRRASRLPFATSAATLSLFALCADSVATASASAGDGGLGISVVTAPSPVPATDGRTHLVYEIAFGNDTRSRVRIDRFEVRSPSRRRAVAAYRGDAINMVMAGFDGKQRRTFARGKGDVLLLDIALPRSRDVPARLEHRFVLSLSAPGRRTRRLTITRARFRVDRRAPIRIGPPLRGPGIGVGGGCCSSLSPHRHGLFERRGRLLFAQRYAIAFLRVVDPLDTFTGDSASNASYFLYGAEIIAVADGRVVAARDGVAENTPPKPPANVTVNGLTGNFVNQDLGHGRFALYAHMQPGSVRVKPGDRVKRGQVLGLVGNSGNSTSPHLHFHVTNGAGGPSNLLADGRPYVFDGFGLDGRVTGLESETATPVRLAPRPPRLRAGQYPLTGDIMEFTP